MISGFETGPSTRRFHPRPEAVAASRIVSATGAITTSCSRMTGTTAVACPRT